MNKAYLVISWNGFTSEDKNEIEKIYSDKSKAIDYINKKRKERDDAFLKYEELKLRKLQIDAFEEFLLQEEFGRRYVLRIMNIE